MNMYMSAVPSPHLKRIGKVAMICCAAIATAVPAWASAAAPQWAPKQPVEVIVPFAPGGAVDRLGRSVQKQLQERKLVPQSFVGNRPGGAGNVAWAFLDKQAGNAHYITITTPTIMTNHIMGRSTYNYSDFTPLAQFFTESVAFAVRTDSPIRDWKDLVARMKKDPTSVSLGSTSREGAAPLTFAMAMKTAGIDPRQMKLVVFNSAGEAATAAAGGHIDLAVVIGETLKPYMQDKRMRVLATSAAKRPAEGVFATVPVLQEHGVDVTFRSWRAVLGPRNLDAAQVAYWDTVFAQMVTGEDWNRELASYDAVNEYQNSANTRALMTKQYEQLKAVMTEIGLAKSQ